MKKFLRRIKVFFTAIDYTALKKSFQEVLYLTLLALLPLLISIVITAIDLNSFSEAVKAKILPGELLAFCLSFLAPSIYLLTKTHGTGYKLPLLHIFSLTSFLIYAFAFALFMIAKNKWSAAINMESHKIDLYFILALSFLSVSIIFRIYSVYHGKNASNWSNNRNKQQEDFNDEFTKSITQ